MLSIGIVGSEVCSRIKAYICCGLLLCRGQAEKEFKVEVEAIGKVRHKNLVGLIGYCADGAQRYIYFPVPLILKSNG